jgi:cytochrome P450
MGHLDKACDSGKPVDMHGLFLAYTLDCFAEIAFKMDCQCLDDISSQKEFARAFDSVAHIVNKRFLDAFWMFTEIISSERAKLNRDCQIMDDFAYTVIRARRAARKRGEETKVRDLLDYFMDAKINDGAEPTDEFLRDMILNFIIAGMLGTLTLLMAHPMLTMFDRTRYHCSGLIMGILRVVSPF